MEVGTPEGDVETTLRSWPARRIRSLHIYGSQDAAILALKNGEVDFVLNSLGLQRGLANQIRTDPNLTVIRKQRQRLPLHELQQPPPPDERLRLPPGGGCVDRQGIRHRHHPAGCGFPAVHLCARGQRGLVL